MARVKLMSAIAFDRDSFDQSGLADPVLRVMGELPASARPFHVHRVYKGAQGRYEESLLLLDPDDIVIWQRPYQFIELRGEMYEDLFRSTVSEKVTIEQPGQHHLAFVVNGLEAGRIPVYIDAKESAAAQGVLGQAIEAGLKKSSVVWVTIPQRDGSKVTRPAWYVQQGKKVFVLTGGDEQDLPGLAETDEVDLTVKSKDIKAAIGVVKATTRVVDNESEEFTKIATLGMGNRLNLPDGEGALERWRNTCQLVELTVQQ